MKASCVNHPDKPAAVRGLCQACYMKERRHAAKAPGAYFHHRTPVGETVSTLLGLWNEDLARRFRDKIDATGGPDACHVWRGTRNKAGYGMITLAGHNVLAHRMAHALATGETSHAVVMHACDNPSCVNPKHLKGGTHQDNVDDMVQKGRGASGSQLGRHLTKRDTHPMAKPVQSPHGTYPSAALAAEALGMHPRKVARYCQRGERGWSYVD